MFYTIMCASSTKNWHLVIDLSKNGNRFEVIVWNRGEHRTVQKHIADNFTEAKTVFDAWCEAYQMNTVKETKPDWTAADFD